ncbi:maltokinase N-terminal cap-like domain-containing protein [Nocardia sp. NBC_00511]|uniref:maltokinase N-terminal cap-like domain-containing protein n=1 Tax=Nocardia sp. NBC_00511 TaxID=2903591 RepID=UPI0030E37DBA
MAEIHETTLTPGKLELLSVWLPTRHWFAGAGSPALSKSGGFRLDDPDGAVGIEVMVVTDTAAGKPVTYLVPMTYRGAPQQELAEALIGTSEHGVLGTRWFYDAAHDPVFIEQAARLLSGHTAPQDQNLSDTPDPTVHGAVAEIRTPTAGFAATTIDTDDHTDIAYDSPRSRNAGAELLRVHRILVPGHAGSGRAHIEGPWCGPDQVILRGVFLSAP